jgi:hypothetical protein
LAAQHVAATQTMVASRIGPLKLVVGALGFLVLAAEDYDSDQDYGQYSGDDLHRLLRHS